MKTALELGEMKIEGVKLESIELDVDFSCTEMATTMNFGKKFISELVDEMTSLIEKLKELDARHNKKEETFKERKSLAIVSERIKRAKDYLEMLKLFYVETEKEQIYNIRRYRTGVIRVI